MFFRFTEQLNSENRLLLLFSISFSSQLCFLKVNAANHKKTAVCRSEAERFLPVTNQCKRLPLFSLFLLFYVAVFFLFAINRASIFYLYLMIGDDPFWTVF